MLMEQDRTITEQVLLTAQREWGGTVVDGRLVPLSSHLGGLIEQEAAPDVDPNLRWFVLLCHPQQERHAFEELADLKVRVYLPTIPRISTRGVRRAKVEIIEPMFRGYLFVKLNLDRDHKARGHISRTPGVHKFLRFDEDYAIVRPDEMARILRTEQAEIDRKDAPYESNYSLGEQVRVSDGPFSGFNGPVSDIDPEGRIKVLISLLGRYTPIPLTEDQIEKL